MAANDDGSDPLVEGIVASLIPLMRTAVTRALDEARASAERSQAEARPGDDVVDDLTRAKARDLLRRRRG